MAAGGRNSVAHKNLRSECSIELREIKPKRRGAALARWKAAGLQNPDGRNTKAGMVKTVAELTAAGLTKADIRWELNTRQNWSHVCGAVMVEPPHPPGDVYRRIGVRPIIHGAGSTTRLGGTRTRPEALEAMVEAAGVLVDMAELNEKAGEVLARVTGAEAGFVSSGSAGGLVLQAAACIAGSDPVKMKQLPDTQSMKNEIIIQNTHRFPYDQAYRMAGAKLVDIGDSKRTHPWELEGAINERTAAVAYLISPFTNRRALSLEQVCEIAHAHGVPVIVDAASTLPPRANLTRFVAQGPDMVIFSGGKGVRGPQGTGILCGRKDLIDAAAAHANPNQFLGRPMKVAKEEIIGLVTALEIFVEEDEEAENRRYNQMCQRVVDALIEVPGLDVSVKFDDYDYLIPHAVVHFRRDWRGRSPDEVAAALEAGDPPIHLNALGPPEDLAVDPLNLEEDELEVLIRRFREELLA